MAINRLGQSEKSRTLCECASGYRPALFQRQIHKISCARDAGVRLACMADTLGSGCLLQFINIYTRTAVEKERNTHTHMIWMRANEK